MLLAVWGSVKREQSVLIITKEEDKMNHIEKIIKGINFNKYFKGILFVFIVIFPLLSFAQDMMVLPGSAFHTDPGDPRIIPQWKQISNYAEVAYPLNVQIPQIASKYPSIIVDKYGNKTFYFNGKPELRIERNGDVIRFRGGKKAFKMDAETFEANGWRLDEKLAIRKYDWYAVGEQNGSKVIECRVTNEWGDVLEYERYWRNNLMERNDSHHNITHIYEYDQSGTGYWEHNLATQVWKRYNNGSPIEERKGSKDGELVAYWRQEGDSLLRIEKISILVVDEEDNPILKDGKMFQYEMVDGDVTKFDKWGSEMYETRDRFGALKITYLWENHHLVKVINYFEGTYEKHNAFGIAEQGVIDDDGTEYASWVHEWKGSLHVKAWELSLDSATGESVYSGKYISYTVEGGMDSIGLEVNEFNQDWINDMYKDGDKVVFEIGDSLLQERYVCFYQVQDMNVEQLRDFFHTTEDVAGTIYDVIQEYKTMNKAGVEMFARASYGLSAAALNKEDIYLIEITFVDDIDFTITASEVDAAAADANFMRSQAQNYLEWGENGKVLDMFDKFQETYQQDLIDLDTELGKVYLRMLSLKVQALEKIVDNQSFGEVSIPINEDPDELKSFISDNFGDLVKDWGQEYVEMVEQM